MDLKIRNTAKIKKIVGILYFSIRLLIIFVKVFLILKA